jgi:DNA-binding NarL/FixJ family response regulator
LVLADPDPLARTAVREGMRARSDLSVVTEAANTAEAVASIAKHAPDVILADTELPPRGALAATIQILALHPTIHVVLFSVHPDEQLALRGLEAGASGFLLKDIDMSALARALKSVARGEAAVSRQLSLAAIMRLRLLGSRIRDMRPVNSPLTDRQWEVLDLLGAGHSVTEISDLLNVSVDTARSHVRMVLKGLGARTPSEAVRVAEGLRAGAHRSHEP